MLLYCACTSLSSFENVSIIFLLLMIFYWCCKYALDQAKKETVDQVCDIVKKQLALADGTEVCGTSKFQDLGADSLDTVSELHFTLKFVAI